jgi:hypothetical protein
MLNIEEIFGLNSGFATRRLVFVSTTGSSIFRLGVMGHPPSARLVRERIKLNFLTLSAENQVLMGLFGFVHHKVNF